MSTRGLLYVLLGIVLIAIAIGLLVVSPLFWESFKTVVIGAITPIIAVFGLVIILIGRELGKLDTFQENLGKEIKSMERSPMPPEMPEIKKAAPEAKKKVKKRKAKKAKKRKTRRKKK